MRSMPWSNTLPSLVEVTVTRASLPSTVSRKVMIQPATRPQPNSPRAKSTPAIDDQHEARKGHLVGRDAHADAPSRDPPRRNRPQPLGDEIGDALVRAGKREPLEREPPLVGNRENEGTIEFLQPGFVALRDLVERHGRDVRRESRPRSALQPGGDRCDLIAAHVRSHGDGSPLDIHFQRRLPGFDEAAERAGVVQTVAAQHEDSRLGRQRYRRGCATREGPRPATGVRCARPA